MLTASCYMRDCTDLDIPSQKGILMLQEFKLYILESLLLAGSISLKFAKKKGDTPATYVIPGEEIRTDGHHHYAVVMSRGRCKDTICKTAHGSFVLYCI